jgi:hypothetical protein
MMPIKRLRKFSKLYNKKLQLFSASTILRNFAANKPTSVLKAHLSPLSAFI